MCQQGNQTVWSECREEISRRMGTTNLTNADIRSMLRKNDGCMMEPKVHSKSEHIALRQAVERVPEGTHA